MDSAQAQLFRQDLEGKSIGGWLIEGYYGHGKSAVVMSGRRDGQGAAVKIFHPELVERFGKEVQLERIRRETGLVGAVHKNVITILGGGECLATGHLYVAMQALPWKNLKEKMADVPREKIRPLIAQLAAGAKFLEDRGLAHRDIKPENIAVNDDLTQLKLLDLGVVRPFGVAGLTDLDARVFIGTLRYSSPEFLMREEVDSEDGWRALTFYQIGAVLHDLLMQKELFAEQSEPFALLVEAVKSVIPDVHGTEIDLVRLCRNCLVKDPVARSTLVSWEHFAPSAKPDGREELLRQIRERQTYYAQVGVPGQQRDAEDQRLLSQKLQVASSTLDYKLGRLLTTLKCFPLHSIEPAVDATNKACTSTISFATDAALGLTVQLKLKFVLTMVNEDIEHPTFILRATCLIDDLQGEAARISSGAVDDVLIDKPIEEWMLGALKATYDAIEEKAFAGAEGGV